MRVLQLPKRIKNIEEQKNFSGSATSVVPGVQSGVHLVDDQLANTRQQVNQRFFAIRYNVLFNLLKVTRLYIFCLFFNLVIIAKFLSDWIFVNINLSITFLQRQLSIIEEIPKICRQGPLYNLLNIFSGIQKRRRFEETEGNLPIATKHASKVSRQIFECLLIMRKYDIDKPPKVNCIFPGL